VIFYFFLFVFCGTQKTHAQNIWDKHINISFIFLFLCINFPFFPVYFDRSIGSAKSAAFHSRIDMSIEKYSAIAEHYRKLVVDSCSLSLQAIYSRQPLDFCTMTEKLWLTAKRIIISTYPVETVDVSKLYIRRDVLQIKAIFFPRYINMYKRRK